MYKKFLTLPNFRKALGFSRTVGRTFDNGLPPRTAPVTRGVI